MNGKLKLSMPLIVEGRYDKALLSGFVDGVILTTGGFSIFNNKEKQALFAKLAKDGIIVLTDSDGGGRQIRRFLSGLLPPDKIHNLFIPQIEGKERRKTHASKQGLLGVEGMEREVIERLLKPFSTERDVEIERKMITKLDFFEDGLSGGDNASERRAALAKRCNLPADMTAKALLEALNLLYGYDEYKAMIAELGK